MISLGHFKSVILDLYPNNAPLADVKTNDVVALVNKRLKQKNGHPLTIILDTSTTIAWDPNVAQILQAFEGPIKEGRLTLVVINSLAKFSMCGLDKFPGGLTQSYCQIAGVNQNLSVLLATFVKEDVYKLSPEVREFFSFFLIDNKQQIEDHIKKIVENTHYVYQELVGNLGQEHALLKLGKRGEKIPMMGLHLAHFLKKMTEHNHVQLSKKEESSALANLNYWIYYYLYSQANKRGRPLWIRPSFGFPHAALTECWSAIRLTIGIEDALILDEYVTFFKDIEKELESTLKDREAIKYLFELIRNPPPVSHSAAEGQSSTIRNFIEHCEADTVKSLQQESLSACLSAFRRLRVTLHNNPHNQASAVSEH